MMTSHEYIPKGICPSIIKVWIDDDAKTFVSASFLGGCHGWTQPILKLLRGKSIDYCIEVLTGTCCGRRGTSCPDQLAEVLKNYKERTD